VFRRAVVFLLICISLNSLSAFDKERNPVIDKKFVEGMLLLQNKDYEKATTLFKEILIIDPNLLRPRLELAKSLYLSGNYKVSKYHFEQVLIEEIPEIVRLNIYLYLNNIKSKVPSYEYSLSFVSDSNPSHKTDAEFIRINGLRFNLSESAKAKEDNGLRIQFLSHIPLNDGQWYLNSNLEITDYPGTKGDLKVYEFISGRDASELLPSLKLEAGIHGVEYQEKLLYDGFSIAGKYIYEINKNSLIDSSIKHKTLDYRNYDYLSGDENSLRLSLIHIPTISSRIETTYERVDTSARENSYAFQQDTYVINLTKEFTKGWVIGGLLSKSNKSYDGKDIIYQTHREDNQKTAEISIYKRDFEIFGMNPKLIIGKKENKSNLEFYTWDSEYRNITFKKEF